MNGEGIETPANKIATAQAVLSLSIRLSAEVESGRVNAEIFKRDVRVLTGGKGLSIPAFPNATDVDLKHGIANIVLIALSASALTLDETLTEVFGNLPENCNQIHFGTRVMVKQLRNAFAHNPWRPKWMIYPKYRKTYSIVLTDGSKFNFDATHLHGDGVKPEQIGGLEFWVKVLQDCEEQVKRVY